jgi:hypothetical protein
MAAGAKYSTELCGNAGLYLDSFLHIAEMSKFGLDLLRLTIKGYQSLAPADAPVTEDDRINLWVKMSSKAANLNLSPYYKAWGWPVTAATEAALAKLPAWKAPLSPPSPPKPSRRPPPAPPARPSPPSSYPPRCSDYSALTVGVKPSVDPGQAVSRLLMWGSAIPLLAGASGDYYAAASRYGLGR